MPTTTLTPEALQRAMTAACQAGEYAELPTRVFDALIAGWEALQERPNGPSYEALHIIARSVAGALARAGVTDCDDPGEAIDVLREGYERRIAELLAAQQRLHTIQTEIGPLECSLAVASEWEKLEEALAEAKQAAQPDKLHQHLLDMLGAKDHEDAGRIVGELHAKAAQPARRTIEDLGTIEFNDGLDEKPASSAGGPDAVREVIADMALATPRDDGLVSQALVFAWREKLFSTLAAPVAGEAAQPSPSDWLRGILSVVSGLTDDQIRRIEEVARRRPNCPAPAAVPAWPNGCRSDPSICIHTFGTDARVCMRCGWDFRKYGEAPSEQPAAPQGVPELFVQWLEREMPGGTVIGRPSWWAPKIVRALRNAERGVLGGCNG